MHLGFSLKVVKENCLLTVIFSVASSLLALGKSLQPWGTVDSVVWVLKQEGQPFLRTRHSSQLERWL